MTAPFACGRAVRIFFSGVGRRLCRRPTPHSIGSATLPQALAKPENASSRKPCHIKSTVLCGDAPGKKSLYHPWFSQTISVESLPSSPASI